MTSPSHPPFPSDGLNTRTSRFIEKDDDIIRYFEEQTYNPSLDPIAVNDAEMHPYPSAEQVQMSSLSHKYHPKTSNGDSDHLLPSTRSHNSAFSNPLSVPSASHKSFRKARGFYVTRLVLRWVVVVLSLAIIGVLSAALRDYQRTKDTEESYAEGSGSHKVWPSNLKVWPSLWLLGTACLAALLGTILLLASLNKKIRHMTKTGNAMTIIVSITGLALWIAVAAYYASWDTKETNWDLMSWACTHSSPENHYTSINFGITCKKMRFAIRAAIALAVLEFTNLIIFLVWLIRRKRAGAGAVGDTNGVVDMAATAMLLGNAAELAENTAGIVEGLARIAA